MVSHHTKQYSPPSLSESHIPVPSCHDTQVPNTAHSCSRQSGYSLAPLGAATLCYTCPENIYFLGHTLWKCDAWSHYHTSNNSSVHAMKYLDFLTVYYLK